MKTIIFICHGNICRSPVGAILFNKYIKEKGLDDEYQAISRATSREEIGNDIYPPMKEVLRNNKISFSRHFAEQISYSEFKNAEQIVYMDYNNLRNLIRMFGESDKYVLISKYLDNKDIEDPWYTDRFEFVFDKINRSVIALINNLEK